jgi:hypothetical protein
VVTTLSDISLIAAMFVLGRTFGQDDKWRSFRVLSLGLRVVALAAFLITASVQSTEWFGHTSEDLRCDTGVVDVSHGDPASRYR